MNYYKEIKENLINNEITKKVKDYSKNRSDLETYYKVGKLLSEAGKHYGEGIIKKYSMKLTDELGKGYSWRNLYNMKIYYMLLNTNPILQPMVAKLNWTIITIILSLKEELKILYYISISIKYNLTKRELNQKIKNKEYERTPKEVVEKIIKNEEVEIKESIKEPIIIRSNIKDKINEKILQKIIVENISEFMKELGEGYSYIDSEYKIKLGNTYNYIDLLLFNIKYNCYVVIELKVTDLRKEHIGQIQTYMNYIDKNIKGIYQDKTIGIILVKRNNEFIIEYSSDDRVLSREYVLN